MNIEENINEEVVSIKKRYAEITYGYRALSQPLEKLCKQKPNRANYNPASTVAMIKNSLRRSEGDCNALLQSYSRLRAYNHTHYQRENLNGTEASKSFWTINQQQKGMK